ncbi:hypothetical protein [Actinoplanes subtropicus]|uniref:hypothetical protein n=1 Tax=Actinoplanes subtropicus TaxID=543632 RepID=UPI0004C2C9A5|nr:hypothetical protein [Actinoplanes subtropicus]
MGPEQPADKAALSPRPATSSSKTSSPLTWIPTEVGAQGGMDSKSLGVVLDIGQSGAVVHARPIDVLASGAHRAVDVLLNMANDDMG